MKVRVLYNLNGTISVVHPAPKSKRNNETEEQWLARVFTKSTPEGLDYEDIEDTELPSREFRNAWEKEKGKPFKINNEKKQLIISAKSKLKDRKARLKDMGLTDAEIELVA